MSRITLDAAAISTIEQAEGVVEVCDAAGRVVGRLYPLSQDYSKIVLNIDEVELERRSRETGGRSLKEIMADLEKRA